MTGTMAAPRHIAEDPVRSARSYTSAPHVPDGWRADRPGELQGPQPWGTRMGTPGPDSGYALTLANRVADDLTLADGEHRADVVAGLAAVASKRAASYGRAPVRHDVEVAATIWGYRSTVSEPELVELRRRVFEGVANPHHYEELRALADLVPEAALRQTPTAIAEAHAADWRSALEAPAEG